jgi:hypothetical protein
MPPLTVTPVQIDGRGEIPLCRKSRNRHNCQTNTIKSMSWDGIGEGK